MALAPIATISLLLLGKFIRRPTTCDVVVDQVPPLLPAATIVLQLKIPPDQIRALDAPLQVVRLKPFIEVPNRFVVEALVAKKLVVVAEVPVAEPKMRLVILPFVPNKLVLKKLVLVALVIVAKIPLKLVLVRVVIVDEAPTTASAT